MQSNEVISMAKKRAEKVTILDCVECGNIMVYASEHADGTFCFMCGNGKLSHRQGYEVGERTAARNEVTVDVKCDTTEVDILLRKLREARRLTGNLGVNAHMELNRGD